MTEHQILNPVDHGALRIHVEARSELGDGVMACLAVPAEFRRLSCEYPILFRYDTAARAFSALALFGFEPGENLFLENDRWEASCRPFAMAVQPFLVGRPGEGAGASQVHVNIGHPRISASGEGVRVFDEVGQPSPYLEEVAAMLGTLDQGHRASGEFFAALARYDLLEPFSMDVTLESGAAHRLVGYHLVHEEKVQALEPGALTELHAAGHLAPIFYAMASIGNLSKLASRKNRKANG